MKNYEKPFLYILFGALLPLILLLAGWWGSLFFLKGNNVLFYAILGLVVGLIANIFFIGKLIKNAYTLPFWSIVAIYIFYSSLVFGFFMAIPLFNLGMSLVGGFYVGRKLYIERANSDKIKEEATKFAMFSTLVLLAICITSTALAFGAASGSAGLQKMSAIQGLSASTKTWIVIFGISAILLTINYLISKKIIGRIIEISIKTSNDKENLKKNISIIVAVAENWAIGKDNKLLWHISEDLKRFKRITAGHTVVMGKNTFESLPVKPLPNRRNLVITDKLGEQIEGCVMAYSIEDAMSKMDVDKENFVIGGASIYKQFFGIAEKLYITRVHAPFDADTFFPEINDDEWKIAETEAAKEKQPDGTRYSFVNYMRIR